MRVKLVSEIAVMAVVLAIVGTAGNPSLGEEAKFEPQELKAVVLDEIDVAPYRIEAQGRQRWPGPQLQRLGVEQRLSVEGGPELGVTVYRFDDEEAAREGADFYAHSMAAGFRQGGLDGETVGESCWAHECSWAAALVFQRGPFCAVVGGLTPIPSERSIITEIAQKLDERMLNYLVQILQLKPLGANALILSPDHFLTTGADGQTKRVPVVMEKQIFQLRGIIEDRESTNEWSGRVWCYEFRSGDPDVPHSYSFWMPDAPQREGVGCWPPDELQFFSLENGDKILAISGEYGSVFLMEVSKANDKVVALKEYLVSVQTAPVLSWSISEVAMSGGTFGRGAAQWRPVPVVQFFGDEPFAHAVGPHHITIEDISSDEARNLVVSVSGIKSDKIYTLVFDGEQWEAQ